MLWEMELPSPKLKKLLIIWEGTFQAQKIKKKIGLKKFSYILKYRTF